MLFPHETIVEPLPRPASFAMVPMAWGIVVSPPHAGGSLGKCSVEPSIAVALPAGYVALSTAASACFNLVSNNYALPFTRITLELSLKA
jgi:hypothetical protein